jgi:nitroreductase
VELKEALEKRRSCRCFRNLYLPGEVLEAIIEAAKKAPFASGGPRREICLVDCDSIQMQPLQEACFNQEYVGEASSALIFCGRDTDTMLKSGHPKYVFDCAAACMCADLMAVSLGLNTCWIGHFDAEKVKAVIGTEYRPTIILLVGVKR